MGTIRVTQGAIATRLLNNLQSQTRRLLDLQEQLSTGLRVNTPSDDPIAARRAISTRALIAKNEQYQQNVSNAGPTLEETAGVLFNMQEIILRARELTLRGANGTNSQGELDALAEEVNQLLESAVFEANHETAGRFIFAGTRTRTIPYDAARDVNGDITTVTYQGNDERFNIAIGEGVTIPINEPGSVVFQGSEDVFQTLIDIRDNLLTGNTGPLQTRLDELDGLRQQFGQGIARVGAVQNRIERAEDDLIDFNIQLELLLSDQVDADFADVIVNLNQQQNAYQAALNAGARIVQPSLLDFLR